MRIQLTFCLDSNEITRNYNALIVSFFKNALSNHFEGKFYDKYYKEKVYKTFTWSAIFKRPQFNRSSEYIVLDENKFIVNITSSNLKDIIIFYNSFLEQIGNEYNYKNESKIVLKKVICKKNKVAKNPTVILKVLSPICIRKHIKETNRDIYISCVSDSFVKELKNTIEYNFEKKYTNRVKELKVDHNYLKKTVVDLFGQKIEVSVGHLILSGNIDLVNEIIKSGLGSRRGLGFGMVDLMEETEMIF